MILYSAATIQGLAGLFDEIQGLLELGSITGSQLGSASSGAVRAASQTVRNRTIHRWYVNA